MTLRHVSQYLFLYHLFLIVFILVSMYKDNLFKNDSKAAIFEECASFNPFLSAIEDHSAITSKPPWALISVRALQVAA